MTLKFIGLPLFQAVRSYQECPCAPVNCSSAGQPRTTQQPCGVWVCIFTFWPRVPTKKPGGWHRQQCVLLDLPGQSLSSKEIRSQSEAWMLPECFRSLLDLTLTPSVAYPRTNPDCHQSQRQPHSGRHMKTLSDQGGCFLAFATQDLVGVVLEKMGNFYLI